MDVVNLSRDRVDEWLYSNLMEELLGGSSTLKASQVLRALHSQDYEVRTLAFGVAKRRGIQIMEVPDGTRS